MSVEQFVSLSFESSIFNYTFSRQKAQTEGEESQNIECPATLPICWELEPFLLNSQKIILILFESS